MTSQCYVCDKSADFICSVCGVSICKEHSIMIKGKIICQTCAISRK